MREQRNLEGIRFGRWTVISKAEPKFDYRGRRLSAWNCKCDCGSERVVTEHSLITNSSKSCGCLRVDVAQKMGVANVTHGMSDTRLYRIYKHMHRRCEDPKDIRYDHYGGRGIRVCGEWSTFEVFSDWALSNGYNDSLSIDRIDLNGNYSPDNCRWATVQEQALNKTNARMIEYNGRAQSIAEWAAEIGMPYKKLWKRIKSGWSPEKALTT